MKTRALLLTLLIFLVSMSPVLWTLMVMTASDTGVSDNTPVPAAETPAPVTSPTPAPVEPPQPDPYEGYDLISRIDGSTATIPLSQAALSAYMGDNEALNHNTTHYAYVNLIEKQSDIVFCTYPSEEEFAYAAEKQIELEIVPVVKDALVFLNNMRNPVENLTQQQVLDIYSGKTTEWDSLGGLKSQITPYQRVVNSGSQTLFLKLVMGDTQPIDAPTELRPMEMGMLIDAVAAYNNAEHALGYSMFYYVSDMYSYDSIRLLSIDGVKPTRDSIAAEQYPYVTHYYAVMRRDTPEDHPVRDYLRWMLSEAGQQVAVEAGYVPLKPMGTPLPDIGFDYPGATRENTTQSSGTGGTKPRQSETPDFDIYSVLQYDDSKAMQFAVLPENPTLERIINEWIDGVYAKCENPSGDVWIRLYDAGSIFSLVAVTSADEKVIDSAVIDSTTGKRLKLSDLFYDGVNYIKYINENLIDSADYTGNWPTWLGDFESTCMLRRFTGYPNNLTDFYVLRGRSGFVLGILMGEDDPFFSVNASNTLQIPLLQSMSPWGCAWRLDYDVVQLKENLELLVPRVVLSPSGMLSEDTAAEDAINEIIKNAAKNAANSEFYKEMETNEYNRQIYPRMWTWEGNLTVIFTQSGWIDAGPWDEVARVDINFSTGKVFDPYTYIPEKWWEENKFSAYSFSSGVELAGYVPPAGSTYSNLWCYDGGTAFFELTEPDGTAVRIDLRR